MQYSTPVEPQEGWESQDKGHAPLNGHHRPHHPHLHHGGLDPGDPVHSLYTLYTHCTHLYTTQALSTERIMMLQMAAMPDTTDTAP